MHKLKIFLPYILMLLGFSIFYLNNINTDIVIQNHTFQTLIHFILAIGLYGAVYSIDIITFKKNLKLILTVITIGVFFKIIFVGLILYLITGEPISFLIATVIAQIDPLSVASLEESKNKLSKDGKSILKAWASFDDPITVLLALSLSLIILNFNSALELELFYSQLYNFIFVILIYIVYVLIKNLNSYIYVILLLVFSFIISIYFELFLAIALIALFLRPKLVFLDNFIYVLFLTLAFIMGILINNGVDIENGILFGLMTILSQVITTFILGRKLEFTDKLRLSFAQQSGITAITLALYFIAQFDSILPTIIIAILTINICYVVFNKFLEMYLKRRNLL